MLLSSCNTSITTENELSNKTVQIILKDGKYQLFRHRKPYYIKGASGTTNLALLKQLGGNSFRTYTTENAQKLLDKAQELGLTVMLGIWVEPYSEHNDLEDTPFRERTFRFIKREVNRYKDHPALLMWGIGNEVHPINPNISAWQFLDECCKLVKELDNNHPVTTSVAGYPRRNIPFMNMYLHNVDFVSFNTFGGIDAFEKKMANPIWGYSGPFLLSEWGFHGYWSVDFTKWHSPIEPKTSDKSARFSTIWNKYIIPNERCIGGYVFFWGQKQEYTNSWYSLFSKDNEKTAIIDSLSSIWGGKNITNYSPIFKSVQWTNQPDIANIRVDKSSVNELVIDAFDAENDSLSITVELRPETSLNVDDMGIESEPLIEQVLINSISSSKIIFEAPNTAGLYRIYLKLSDSKGSCDMVNFVFKVNESTN